MIEHISYSTESSEARAAQILIDKFKTLCPAIEYDDNFFLKVISSFILNGNYKTKEIDLILIGSFDKKITFTVYDIRQLNFIRNGSHGISQKMIWRKQSNYGVSRNHCQT